MSDFRIGYILRCYVLFIVFLLSQLQSGVPQELHFEPLNLKHANLLESASMKNIANQSAIITWQGSVQIDQKGYLNPDADGLAFEREALIDFYWDRVHKRCLVLYTYLSRSRTAENNVTEKLPLTIGGILWRDEVSYKLERKDRDGPLPIIDKNGKVVGYRLFHDPKDISPVLLSGSMVIRKGNHLLESFDPVEHFNPPEYLEPPGVQFAMVFQNYAKALRDNVTTSSRFIAHNGSQLTLKSVLDSNVNEYEVDLDKRGVGVGMAAYDPTHPQDDMCCRASYQEVDNVWVPCKINIENGNRTLLTSLVWKRNVVNESIPDEVFNLKTLGLKQGDAVYDKRNDTSCVVTDEAYPVPDHLKKDYWKRSEKINWQLVIIIISLIVMVTILMLRVRRKLRVGKRTT